MPRLMLQAKTSGVSGSGDHTIILTISGNLTAGLSFSYNQSLVNCSGGVGQLTVQLVNQTPYPNPEDVYIQDYICTDPDSFGTVVRTPFDPGTVEITFDLNLAPHLLIEFGVFVAVTDPADPRNTTYLFCDPQVGNDPD
jgi:hypothetical protein